MRAYQATFDDVIDSHIQVLLHSIRVDNFISIVKPHHSLISTMEMKAREKCRLRFSLCGVNKSTYCRRRRRRWATLNIFHAKERGKDRETVSNTWCLWINVHLGFIMNESYRIRFFMWSSRETNEMLINHCVLYNKVKCKWENLSESELESG